MRYRVDNIGMNMGQRSGRPSVGAAYSALVGAVSRTPLPKPVRTAALTVFAKLVNADVAEAALPLSEYDTLGKFFARRLRAGARSAEAWQPGELVAPSDGVIAEQGRIVEGTVVQAKGHLYRIDELLAQETQGRFEGGQYCTIYLSPRDYHRVHTPSAGTLRTYRHVPGELWPVSKRFVARVDNLFTRNERVVIELETPHGVVALVMVAALGVGNMWLSHVEGGCETRGHRFAQGVTSWPCDQALQAGDEVGAFLLGSTVVMLVPPGFPALACRAGAVRMGEALTAGGRVP